MELTPRQKQILEIVRQEEPVTSHELAQRLSLTRAALRTDLAVLTMARILEAKPRVGYFCNDTNRNTWLKDLLLEAKVSDAQGVPVVVEEKTSLLNAAITFFTDDVDSLFVVDRDGEFKGIIRSKDLIKVMLGEGDLAQLPASVAMTKMSDEKELHPHDPLFTALSSLKGRDYEVLPVLMDNQLVGRITREGILGYLYERLKKESDK